MSNACDVSSLRRTLISMGLEKGVSLGHYMENWRVQRKLFHQYMNKVSVRKYWPTIEQDARAFVLRVLDNNEDFWKETRL